MKPIPPFWDRLGQLPEWLLRKGIGAGVQRARHGARARGADEGLADVLTRMGPERDRVVDRAGRLCGAPAKRAGARYRRPHRALLARARAAGASRDRAALRAR
jgi:hypothetical protein